MNIALNECACFNDECHSRRVFNYWPSFGFEKLTFYACVSAMRADYLFKKPHGWEGNFNHWAFDFLKNEVPKHVKDHKVVLYDYPYLRTGKSILDQIHCEQVFLKPDFYEIRTVRELIEIKNYYSINALKDVVFDYLKKYNSKQNERKAAILRAHINKAHKAMCCDAVDVALTDFILELFKQKIHEN